MAVITTLARDDLEALLTRYDIGELGRYWPASNGIENTNYFLRLKDCRGDHDCVATVLEQPSSSDALLIPLLDLCDHSGLPVAVALRNRYRQAIDEICGKPVLISPRLSGRHVFNPTVAQCRAIGRFLARFHTACLTLTSRAQDYPRDAVWLQDMAALAAPYVSFSEHRLMTESIRSICSLLQREDVQRLPQGIIHGDLFRDNALFNERGLSGVLDFHHAAKGYWVYDLAVAANDWCNDSEGIMDLDRSMALLRAYHRLRPLTQQELWYFPVFSLYAAMAFWLSRLTVALRARNGADIPFNNPQEFQRLVSEHAARFFYLDQRLLEQPMLF